MKRKDFIKTAALSALAVTTGSVKGFATLKFQNAETILLNPGEHIRHGLLQHLTATPSQQLPVVFQLNRFIQGLNPSGDDTLQVLSVLTENENIQISHQGNRWQLLNDEGCFDLNENQPFTTTKSQWRVDLVRQNQTIEISGPHYFICLTGSALINAKTVDPKNGLVIDTDQLTIACQENETSIIHITKNL